MPARGANHGASMLAVGTRLPGNFTLDELAIFGSGIAGAMRPHLG
jgi:hypothetical protein